MPLQRPSLATPARDHAATPKIPDFFLIGAPKCGTTALAEYLSNHPDIFMAKKEMHHFGSDLRFGRQIFRREQPAYLAEFNAWNGQTLAGEASVWYLYSAQAAAEIKAFNPKARILIMLRDPAEMLYSLYYQFRLDGNEHLSTFEKALAAQEDRRAGRRVNRCTYFPQGLLYQDVARFTEQISRYFKMFGREQVHVVIYDDFAAETKASYGRVLDFLRVDSTKMDSILPVINPSQTLRSSFLRNLMSDPLVRGTAVAMHSWLPKPLFRALQKIEVHLQGFNIRPAKRPQADTGLRLRLQREFAPEIERLSELLGRDLTGWSKSEPVAVKRSSEAAAAAKLQPASDATGTVKHEKKTTPTASVLA